MEYWVPLLSALAGALIGSITTVATVIVQSRRDELRHLRDVAARLAMEDYKHHMELAKSHGPRAIYPMSTYFAHHHKLLMLAATGELTAAKFKEIEAHDRELRDILDEQFKKETSEPATAEK